ncbi:MAG: hypothetical protein ACWGPS_01630 [Candidatus Promineifilaceae bacterium]
MNRNRSWIMWAVVAGIIIVSGLASAIIPFVLDQSDASDREQLAVETEAAPVVISVEDYVLGDLLVEIPFIQSQIDGRALTQAQALGLMVGITLVAVGIVGVPLAFIFMILGRQVEKVYDDESFQTAQSELGKKEQARIKELRSERPIAPEPEPAIRSRWSAFVFALIALMFVWFTSLALGIAYFGDTTWTIGNRLVDPASIFSLVCVVIATVGLIIYFRVRDPALADPGASDYQPVNWGWIWVLLSGLLVVGIGAGLAFALRGGMGG